MSFMTAISPCIGCGKIFSYNPDLVPSSSAVTGRREPICATCIGQINAVRKPMGQPVIVPLPGAYEAQEVA